MSTIMKVPLYGWPTNQKYLAPKGLIHDDNIRRKLRDRSEEDWLAESARNAISATEGSKSLVFKRRKGKRL